MYVLYIAFFAQIGRATIPNQGRLVIKLSEEPARWLVTFDRGSWKDEELSEDVFGSVVGRMEETEVPAAKGTEITVKDRKNKKKNRNKASTTKNEGKGGSTNSSSEDQSGAEVGKKKKKTVSFSQERQPTDTDASSPKDQASKKRGLRSKVSDREQRSRRRQQMIEEEAQTLPAAPASSNNNHNKRPRPHGGMAQAAKKSKTGAKEEVIKVPMLTGTLYLYKGLRRRAEFIRKY